MRCRSESDEYKLVALAPNSARGPGPGPGVLRCEPQKRKQASRALISLDARDMAERLDPGVQSRRNLDLCMICAMRGTDVAKTPMH